MTAPVGYSRATYVLHNELLRPLTGRDAQEMLGAELTASLHGAELSSGIVTDAVVVDDGRRLQVTIESGGRRCAACGRIYSPEQVGDSLAAGDPAMPADPAPWLLICRDESGCVGLPPRRSRKHPGGPV